MPVAVATDGLYLLNSDPAAKVGALCWSLPWSVIPICVKPGGLSNAIRKAQVEKFFMLH